LDVAPLNAIVAAITIRVTTAFEKRRPRTCMFFIGECFFKFYEEIRLGVPLLRETSDSMREEQFPLRDMTVLAIYTTIA
jgi:hypothetical protein